MPWVLLLCYWVMETGRWAMVFKRDPIKGNPRREVRASSSNIMLVCWFPLVVVLVSHPLDSRRRRDHADE
jgi:hypothetical protein